jgi:ubiquinone/menaquinone biosynthesis C-methylase UbiE
MSKFPFDIEPRGNKGRLERLALLDVESRDDFLTGFRVWGTAARRMTVERFNMLLERAGLDPEEKNPDMDTVFKVVEGDHIVGVEARSRTGVHDVMHRNFDQYFTENAETYLAEMEAYDTIGPGTLELNPEMDIPEYACHEIHTQPGGYVGNPFAGHIYHYSTNNFYNAGRLFNYQDELHTRLGSQVPTPEDGKVLRVLDIGCGIGQLAVALKERFPNAEVWGIDVGGPMIRYGHMRAVELGVDVNFAQRLAEDTKFPDNHFDIAASYILNHEVPEEISKAITREMHRVLRPGGVYFPIDFQTGSSSAPETAYAKYAQWKDHRWNTEVWRQEYSRLDFPKAMEEAGFDVVREGPPAWRSRYNLMAIKRA